LDGKGASLSIDAQREEDLDVPGVDEPIGVEIGALVDAPLELAGRLGVPMPELTRIGALLRLKAAVAGLLPATT
jgi:hypothetical protein